MKNFKTQILSLITLAVIFFIITLNLKNQKLLCHDLLKENEKECPKDIIAFLTRNY